MCVSVRVWELLFFFCTLPLGAPHESPQPAYMAMDELAWLAATLLQASRQASALNAPDFSAPKSAAWVAQLAAALPALVCHTSSLSPPAAAAVIFSATAFVVLHTQSGRYRLPASKRG